MKVRAQVQDVDYTVEEGRPVVRLFGKTIDGDSFLGRYEDFNPYFYALTSKPDELEENLETSGFSSEDEDLPVKKIERVERINLEEGVSAIKIYTSEPPKVPKLKDEVKKLEAVEECREFDIPFYKRFLIDKDLQPVSTYIFRGEELESDSFEAAMRVKNIEEGEGEVDFNHLSFDLEVYEGRIIMASIKGENYRRLLSTREIGLEFVEEVEGEKELIQRLMEILEEEDVDILTGYNTDEFDFKKLRERAQEHDLELSLGRNGERMKFKRRGRFSGARIKGRMHLDIYPFVAHVLSPALESEVLDLDSIAEELLGKNKQEMSWKEMKRAWREGENLEEFAEYAMKDAELSYELGEELVPQMLELSRITGLIPFDSCRLTYGQLTENFLLKEAYRRDMIAPNRPTREQRNKRNRQEAYTGGFVYSPDPGLYENIGLLDFRSLYPTVMVAHNISPDTINVEDCEDSFEMEEYSFSFCQDSQGFFPELVENLVEDRSRLKEEMKELEKGSKEYRSVNSRQQAEKILANSFYGYLGYSGARWYSRECAEATTSLGRKYIQDSIERAEEKGFEVVYGDTDSLFLRGEKLKEDIEDFLEEVNDELPEFMELELEGYFTRGFFTSTDSGEGAKKKYALKDEGGDLKITGFEYVRRDWSPLAKETQKEVLEEVLEEEIEDAAGAVKQKIEKIRKGEIPVEKMSIYTKLTKKPENYESTAPHVEAAKKAIDRGKDISPGDTIEYVITRGGGNISSRAELPEFAESYDPDYYIENQIIPVSHRVLKVFGYTKDQLKGKGKQSGLGRFN